MNNWGKKHTTVFTVNSLEAGLVWNDASEASRLGGIHEAGEHLQF